MVTPAFSRFKSPVSCTNPSGVWITPLLKKGRRASRPTQQAKTETISSTNAAKHGAGRINVEYNILDGFHELLVCDEGDGLPKDFNQDFARAGLGMKVVTTLAMQLGGKMTAGGRIRQVKARALKYPIERNPSTTYRHDANSDAGPLGLALNYDFKNPKQLIFP